ncbi:ssk1 response regulator receiver [Entomortierella beljakovae]|nr:ssk1 response regulator receiver [Entomortierella beljakovae]
MVKENPIVLNSTTQVNGNPSPLGASLDTNASDAISDANSLDASVSPLIFEKGLPTIDSTTTSLGQHSTAENRGGRNPRFKLQSRPAQLIRNLHASYFNQHLAEISSPGSIDSAVANVIYSIRSNVFAFGAVVSVVGCAFLLVQERPKYPWHVVSVGHFGLIFQLFYHGIFAVTSACHWLKRLSRIPSRDGLDGANSENEFNIGDSGRGSGEGSGGDTEPSRVLDSSSPSTSPSLVDSNETFTESSDRPRPIDKTNIPLVPFSYFILGFGVVGLFFPAPSLIAPTWISHLFNPLMSLARFSPLMVGICLLGLDKISLALAMDETRLSRKLDDLQDRHESLMEAFRDDNLHKKNILLETVGKEVQDAATLAIETLSQMTPNSLFPPSVSREQLSPCTLPMPITSILGLFTTMRHLQYISRNMQRLSRVMFTEYVQGIVEKTSPHYHRGENKFDVGEFVQSLGDLVSADASLKGIEFVLYHSEYDMNHVLIKGSEESWRHALINLIKSIIDCAKSGSTVELCLALFALPNIENNNSKVMVSFEITYYPDPDSKSTEDDLAQLNALLASKLVKAMGGSLEIDQLEHGAKRFIVSVEVVKAGNLKLPEEPTFKPVHPLEPAKSDEASQSSSSQENLYKLESLQTTHPIHDSQQFLQHHIKTPVVSPSPTPASPPPRRAGGGGVSPKISAEPTVQELNRFSRKLAGLKVILLAKEQSAFAVRLTGYLKSWGISVVRKPIRGDSNNSTGASGDIDTGEYLLAEDPPVTPGAAKRTNTSSSANSSNSSLISPSVKQLSGPAFIMIDDDVKVLGQQILKMQSSPPSPAPISGAPKRPTTHRRHKSITSVQQTSIIYFTSLPTFKQARDTITFILGTQIPGVNYSISNSLSGSPLGQPPFGLLPYILVLPKPAGPRRVLTAIHTAIHVPVLDQSYSPIATAPTSPAPPIRHFSEEVNPLDRDQYIIDPISNQAFARTVPNSTQSSPGGLSPNPSLPQDQRQRRDIMRRLIDAGDGVGGQATYPLDNPIMDLLPQESPGSITIGSPTGIIIPGTTSIEFDPTVRTSGTLSPSINGPGYRRISNGSGRHLTQSLSSNSEGGAVVIPPNINAGNHQPFALVHAQRSSEGGAPPNFIRINSGQIIRPGTGRSPLATPPAITQSSHVFSPPTMRHSAISSPLPQRPESAAMRSGGGSVGTLGGTAIDSPKLSHPVLPHGSLTSSSPLPTSPGSHSRTSPGGSGMALTHASSPPPADAVTRPRNFYPVKKLKEKDAKPLRAQSLIKNDVVERVSPLVNVLIVEDNHINQQILAKFMRQRKIKYDTARNGREAVDKWRVGGFHLVLMDIQMPVMDGIEATREIRSLERAQKIGVFPTDKPNSVGNTMMALAPPTSSSSSTSSPPSSTFRSPVIIVALTATAESEDLRKTALLAGCNDYITKPVELSWLERKIVDWGCMQALIDVDAWKEWKRDLEGTSPGSPSVGPSSAPSSGKKLLSSVGSVTRANLKRPSISSRSIKGSKAAAAAAAAAAAKNAEIAAAAEEKDKKNEKSSETSDTLPKGEITEKPGSSMLSSRLLPTIPEGKSSQHEDSSILNTENAMDDESSKPNASTST